jgi:hypothetical protein
MEEEKKESLISKGVNFGKKHWKKAVGALVIIGGVIALKAIGTKAGTSKSDFEDFELEVGNSDSSEVVSDQ